MRRSIALSVALALSSCSSENPEQWTELSATGYYFPANVSRVEAFRVFKQLSTSHGFHEAASGKGLFDRSLHAVLHNDLGAVANILVEQNSPCIQLSIRKRSNEDDFEKARTSALQLTADVSGTTHWAKSAGGCPYAP